MADETFDIVIINGLVVTVVDIQEADVAIVGEKIAAVRDRGSFKNAQAKKTIDAEGGWVTPGGIVSLAACTCEARMLTLLSRTHMYSQSQPRQATIDLNTN